MWAAVGLVAVGVACTTTPPAIDTEGSSTGATTGSTGEPTTGSTGTTLTTVTTTPPTTNTTNTGQCQVASDCVSPCAFCYYGTCYEYQCPPECYSADSNCPIGELCEHEECVEVTAIPVCERQTLTLSAIPLQDAPDGLLLADIDGDGHLDLVATEPASGMLEIAAGDGAGGFAVGDLVPTGLTGDAQRVAVADFDLDGDPDLAVADAIPTGQLSLLFGQDAMFMPPVLYTLTDYAPLQLFAGRVDDDMNPDVLVVADEASILLRTGDGMGGLNEPVLAGSNESFAAAAAGDLDGDGTLELAVPLTEGATLRRYALDGGEIGPSVHLDGLGLTPFNAALVAELSGTPTLIASRRASGVGMISLWSGDGGQSETPTIDVAIPGGAFVVTGADFDGDGRTDLLVLKGENSLEVRVVYFGAAGPECVQIHALDHWAAAPRIAVADVDGDALPDIVVGDPSSASASLLRSGP